MRAYEDALAGKGAGTTFNAITGNQLKTFEIPLPPLPEQRAIVSEVESRLSVADAVEKTVTAELKRAEQLRQSILKKPSLGNWCRRIQMMSLLASCLNGLRHRKKLYFSENL